MLFFNTFSYFDTPKHSNFTDIFLNEDISLSKKAATKFLVRRKRGWWSNAAEECREGCSWEECEENSSSREGGVSILR